MCMIARSQGFVIGCPCFLVGMRVGSLDMIMSMFLVRLAAIVFIVISVGSSGNILSHWSMAVRGSCEGYW